MAAKSDIIQLPITAEDVRSIHNAYRYHLAGLPLSALSASVGKHNNDLAQMLARYIFQKHLRLSQVPFSTRQTIATTDPVGRLMIGGRKVRFYIHFSPDNEKISEITLTKFQVDQLTDADDINIFAELIHPRKNLTAETGAYYFLPPLPADERSNVSPRYIQTEEKKVKLFGVDQYHAPIDVDLKPPVTDPIPVPSGLSRLTFLFCPTRPEKIVRISAPPSSYVLISPTDWSMLGINANSLLLTGWQSSFQLKRMIHDRLSIDTEFRIRYFKTEKCSLSLAELRTLPRLLALAKQLDKGT